MRTGLVIIGVWSGVLLLLSLTFGGCYSFALPFILSAGLCVLLVVLGLIWKQLRATAFWVVMPLHGLLFFPYRYAIARWPGGDDGPGMAWLILVGGGSLIAAFLAIMVIAGVCYCIGGSLDLTDASHQKTFTKASPRLQPPEDEPKKS